MLNPIIFSLPIFGFLALSSAAEQKILSNNGDNPLDTKFSKMVNETLNMFHVPGISIAVVDGDDMWAEVSWIVYLPNFCKTLCA
jgi:hypothetical protein